MKNRVYNKAFGKIVRTLGFLLILGASVFISTQLIIENDTLPLIDNLMPYADMVNNIIASMTFIAEYAGLALVVGLIFLIWAIRRGIVLRVLLTVALLFIFIDGSNTGTTPLAPIVLASPAWIATVLPFVQDPMAQLVALSEYIVPGIAVGVPFLLWAVFAYKKPGRFSIFLLRLGSITLFLAVAMLAVAELFVPTLQDLDIYETIRVALYVITYLMFMIGSLFGVLGFARK